MIFTSFHFLLFFSVLFLVYYLLFDGKTKVQNSVLLISSYIFYGIADWRMIPLLFLATLITYILGIKIHKSTEKTASFLTTFGIFLGVGLLVYFKYFNFFIDGFSSVLNTFGLQSNSSTFNIILPLGISFFTFKLISYVVEINNENITPTTSFVEFATYISFFPTILSGPIDKPNTFLPQLKNRGNFNFELACDGARQFLWGLFKKMVIADNLALVVNEIWEYQDTFSSSTLVLGAILYSIQLYADFSGYSDMAIGIGKILGFRITKNFNYPFFAKGIADFWRRWHMSLTSWLTDYVFTPLNFAFRQWKKWGTILAILLNFAVVGLWHGANLTFLILGIYFGLLFIPSILSGSFFKNEKRLKNKFWIYSGFDFLQMATNFLLVSFGFIFFRAENEYQAFNYINNIFTPTLFTIPKAIGYTNALALLSFLFVIIMFVYEWKSRNKDFGLQIDNHKISVQFLNYIFIAFLIYFFGATDTSSFIYFQF